MPLVTCSDCGKEVSTSAVACPHCGKPAVRKRPAHRWWYGLVAPLALLVVAILVYQAYRAHKAPNDLKIVTAQATEADKTSTIAKEAVSLDLAGQLERISREGRTDDTIIRMMRFAFREDEDQKDRDETFVFKLEKDPERFAGRAFAFVGKITQIFERNGRTGAFIQFMPGHNFYIEADFVTDLVQGNHVEVVGYLAGEHAYESVAGWHMSVPAIAAASIGSSREENRLMALYKQRYKRTPANSGK